MIKQTIFILFISKNLLKKDTICLNQICIEDRVLDKILDNPYPNLALVKFESWMDGTSLILDENDQIEKFISPSHLNMKKS